MPYDLGNTCDVEDATCERSSYRGFSFGKRYPHISSFQGTAIVSPVSAEPTAVVNALELFYKLMLLVGRHSCKNLAACQHLINISVKAELEQSVFLYSFQCLFTAIFYYPAEYIATDSKGVVSQICDVVW